MGKNELSIAQLVRFLVMELIHQSLSSRLGTNARFFLDLFQDLTGDILSVVDDVPVDSKASVVILSILTICGHSLSKVLIRIRLGECECVYERLRLYCVLKKSREKN